MIESLSIQQARKLVLQSQRVMGAERIGAAAGATLSAIEHLGYVQIDAISVIERAHHHTLWNRNPRYQCTHIDQLMDEKKVFEYWAHAASYLPIRDYRFSLPRKRALSNGEMEHWYERDDRMMKWVLDRIQAEGPLMAKDFEHEGKRTGEWRAKPAKRALEYLFMQGDLMAPCRVNFHKVYDLTERVLPEGVNALMPSQGEYARYLIHRYLRANGLGQPDEIAYLLKGMKPLVRATLQEMVFSGELVQVCVAGAVYHALPTSLELLGRPLARKRLRILSPFDNLVIQRRRMAVLFGFDFLIECYVPEAKRRYGYFCLPVLWEGRFVARMDCRTERRASLLHIHHLALEPGLRKTDSFFQALRRELLSFLKFNGCERVQVHRVSPDGVKGEFESVLGDLIG